MIKDSIGSYALYFSGALVAFFFQLFAASVLGASEFGKANYYLGYALTIMTFTCFGVQFFLPKYLHQQKNPTKFVSVTFWTISILYILIFPAIYFILRNLLFVELVLIYLLAYSMVIFGLFRSYYVGISEPKKGYFLFFILQLITAIIFIVLLLLFSTHYTYFLALLIGYLFIIIFEFFHIIKGRPAFSKEVIKFSISFYLVQISYGLFTSVSRILQKDFGSFEIVGILSVALVLGSAAAMFGQVVAQVIMPEFSKAWANKDQNSINKYYFTATRLNAYLIAPVAIFSIINSEKILHFFGNSYSGGGIILAIILVSSFFSTLVGPNGTLLNMSNNQRYEIFNGLLGLAFAIIFAFYFGSLFIWGIAAAIALSEIVRNCAKTIEVRILFNLWPLQRKIVIFLLLMFCLEVISFWLISMVNFDMILWIFVNGIVILMYIVCTFCLSPEKEDKVLLNAIMDNTMRKFDQII